METRRKRINKGDARENPVTYQREGRRGEKSTINDKDNGRD